MQTPILQTPISGAGNGAASVKSSAGPGAPDNQFQKQLSSQIERRQPSSSASGTSAAKTSDKPLQQAKPSARAEKNDARAPDEPATPAPAAQPAPVSASENDTDANSAVPSELLTGPVADMLALVASFNQAAAPVVARPATLNEPAIEPEAAGAAVIGARFGATPPATDALPPATGGKDLGVAGIPLADAPGVQNEFKLDRAAAAVNGAPRLVPERAEAAPIEPGKAAMGGRELAAVEGQGKPPSDPSQLTGAKGRESTPEPIAAVKDAAANVTGLTAPVQQASLEIAQAIAAPADKMQARVGTQAWDQQLGQKIVWMVAGGQQSASLTLNPPDLGPLQVVLSVHNDQTNAAFSSAQPEVRQALEAALPRLREMMNEAGIALGNATVSAGSSQQHNGPGGQARPDRAGVRVETANPTEAIHIVRPASHSDGLVNTFA